MSSNIVSSDRSFSSTFSRSLAQILQCLVRAAHTLHLPPGEGDKNKTSLLSPSFTGMSILQTTVCVSNVPGIQWWLKKQTLVRQHRQVFNKPFFP